MLKKRNILIAVTLFVIVVLLIPTWSKLYCRHEDINIKTGQSRITRFLCSFQMSQQINDTPLSRALQGETIDVADIQAWHRVNTFYWGRKYSPHYIFHGAFGQAKELELILDMLNASDVQRKNATIGLLSTWQKSGNDSKAETFLNELQKQLEQGDAVDSLIATRSQSG